jgi:lipoprotein-anchoring transpeptidase ErfK/SrfK
VARGVEDGGGATGARVGRSRRVLIAGIATLLALAFVALGASTWAWGDGLRDEQRLLPGTTIAAVDVGGRSMDEAVADIEAHLAARLDRVVTVTDDDRSWEVTLRELGADTDAATVVADAFTRTVDASLTELARIRWAGSDAGVDLDVAVAIPDENIGAFVADLAAEVDLAASDAELTWTGDDVEVTAAEFGREVDREAATAALASALNGDDDAVVLPVEDLHPTTTTETAQQVADEVTARVEGALGRTVTLSLGERRWQTDPRELGATADVEPLLAAGLAAGGDLGALPDLELDLPDDAVAGLVARIASEVDQPARDARIQLVGGKMEVTPEREGSALDRDAARSDLRAALAGSADAVSLRTVTVRPTVTRTSFDRLLYLDQGARTLSLIEGGEVVQSWPVAVGMGGSPTPTGTFTVGAKRYEPTWYNPAKDRWGSDMPAQMGPGPDNPLGPRALNWNRDGRDTLIRFHGTPNEDSIGEAASRGCVRMYNADVIELYDLVPSGIPILSVAG